MNSAISGGRKLSFDVIRIVALLLIVLTHISAYIVIYFPETSGSEFIIGNIFNGISRAGVPMFVMLSGALLLNEDKKFETSAFYKRSLLWMGLLLIGWLLVYGVFYAVVLPISVGEAPSVDQFVNYLLTFDGSNYPHLWYMFMVIGMYLMIPVLRLFVVRKNRKYIFWLIVGCFIVQFVAKTMDVFVAEGASINVSKYLDKFHVEPLTGFMGFVLLGWYLTNFEMKKRGRYLLYVAGILALVCSTVIVQYKIDEIPSIRSYVYGELSLPAFIYGTAIFVLIMQICKNKNTVSIWTKGISNYCFGVYIIHVIFLELFIKFIPYENTSCGVLFYILLSYLAVLIASFITVFVIGKIPYVRKIFYLK